jgi:AraC-like DNA-binding protein
MMDRSFETLLLSQHVPRKDTCIGARSLYTLEHGAATLKTPSGSSEKLTAGDLAWVPAGVSHRLVMPQGQCLVLRLRKGAFSRDQQTDVQARILLNQLDTWARMETFRLPERDRTHGKDLRLITQNIRAIIACPDDPFLAKAETLSIFRHFVGLLPELPPDQELPPAPARIHAFIDWLKEHHAEKITITDALQQTSLSKSHFQRCFRDVTGTSLSRYLNRERISVAKNLLAFSQRGILDIAFSCGFTSTSRFYDVFSHLVGCSPNAYRRQRRAHLNVLQ